MVKHLKVPNYIMEHFRYRTDTMNCIKEDIRSGNFTEDDIWYENIIGVIGEIEDWSFLGFTEEQYYELIKHFEEWSFEDKTTLCKEKYGGSMTEKEKAIEALLEYYDAIYNRFLKKLDSLMTKKF